MAQAQAAYQAKLMEAMAANPEIALTLNDESTDESLALRKIVLNMMVAAFMKFDVDGSNTLSATEVCGRILTSNAEGCVAGNSRPATRLPDVRLLQRVRR